MSNSRRKTFRLSGLDRRQFLLASMLGLTGCGTISRRGQSPDEAAVIPTDMELDNQDVYIKDLTGVWGLNHFKVEGVGLVTRLNGSGSDPSPSQQRTMLLSEMQSHRVPEPNGLLARNDTSMVIVQGYMPPAIRKGERFDVHVVTMPQSETTSLENGFLMQARMRQMEVLGGRMHEGRVSALAKGGVVVDSVFGSDSPITAKRGRIYGGAIAMTDRPVGLAVQTNSRSVMATTRISRNINARFSTVSNGGKAGVATPKNDQSIELVVPLLYRDNVSRYLGVVSNIIYRESSDVVTRIDRLQKELLEPSLAARAATRLEAIGKEGISSLNRGARSQDIEVQFYSAESLAYLGESSAAKALGRIAQEEPAFRWRAMAALSAMDDLDAGMALSDLLHADSAETRYGAFRSLHARSSADPAIHAEELPKADFAYHVIPTNEQPMIHFSKSRRSEIVLFGHDQRVNDNFLFIENGLTVKADNGLLKITRFSQTGNDERIECSTTVDDLVRNLNSLGYGYGDLLKVLRKATDSQTLDSRLVIDATPKPNRKFVRSTENQAPSNAPQHIVSGPLPELFRDAGEESKVRQASYEASDQAGNEDEYDPVNDESDGSETKKKRPLRDKMKKVFRR